MKVALEVNGAAREVDCDPWKRLLDLLREDLRLTGTKEGCGEGECGACTVILDGRPVNSCLVAAGQCHGRAITTVEGLAGDALHEVQQALVVRGGAQCGICTPGIAVCASHVVDREPGASRDRIRELLAGNVCRCTGYQLIVDAVEEAAAARRAHTEPARGPSASGGRGGAGAASTTGAPSRGDDTEPARGPSASGGRGGAGAASTTGAPSRGDL